MASRHKKKRRHYQRDDLPGKHPAGDIGQLSFAVLFFVIWGIDTVFLNYTNFLNQYLPSVIRIPIGVILLLVSLYMAFASISVVYGKNRQASGVIRKSVYAIVRHPIYLSEILLYLGLFMMSLSLAAGLVLIAVIVFLNNISRYEEHLLLDRFGKAYEEYLADVPMWLPRLWKR
jgi:protein-S-isoprenylcysteine O-methyltransferase Ste14